MGLDSVELLVSFENYFNIRISDLEAEKIGSVGEMVNCVSKHLNITNQDESLKQDFFEKLKSTLIQNELADKSLSYTDRIFSILDPDNKETWAKISKQLDLRIPQPFREADTFLKKVFFSGWRPKYNWKDVSVDQFITAICADNYEKFIDPKSFKTKYEILVAITAITSDKLGLDVYEVQPEKQFAEDFGID